jgi:hypothetical protein
MGRNFKINKSVSVIVNYFLQFSSAFKTLEKEIPDEEIEKLAVEIVRAMGSWLRDYHKPEHSIDVARGQTAFGQLAGIFHDCVYVQVDPSWRKTCERHLGNFIPSEDLTLNTQSIFKSEENLTRKAIVLLFGMERSADVKPGKGINEFLSSLVMESMLRKYLTAKEILSVAACIEATIPFRKVDLEGHTPADRLHQRLTKAMAMIDQSISSLELEDIIWACRGIVESDLSSFAAVKFNVFISNTWNVMNENNPALQNTFFFVSEYRKAVYGVVPFLQSLNPEQMFWTPQKEKGSKSAKMIVYAKRNLAWGVYYLRIVGLALSIVEAVALETGGDLPYETLVGPLRRGREHVPESVGAFLSHSDSRPLDAREKEIFLLLKNGREMRARFDRKDCPIGAYIFQILSPKKLERLMRSAELFHAGKLSGKNLLRELPLSVAKEVITAISRTLSVRETKMDFLLSELFRDKAA